MEALTQIVFIGYHLLTIGIGFGLIGRTVEDTSRYTGVGLTAFLYGMWTVSFLLWWDPADMVSMIAMIVSIGLLWGPWIIDLPDIHKPYPVMTLRIATQGAFICAARIGLVLGFWTLY